MRNLKKALSLALALVMLLGMMMVGAGAAKFEDVPDGADNQEAVEVMAALEIIKGDENGFRPDDTLLRAEAAVIISKVLLTAPVVEKLDVTTTRFTDMADYDWAIPYVEACATPGIIAGNGDGTYGPGDELTGVAFAKMLLVTLGFDPDNYNGKANWEMLVQQDAIKAKLDANGVVITSGKLSRAAAAQMAFNAITEYSPSGEEAWTVDGKAFDSFIEAYLYADKLDKVNEIEKKAAKDSLAVTRFKLDSTDTEDAFGRSTKTWTVDGKEAVVVAGSAPVLTYTEPVTEKQLFADLGATGRKESGDYYVVMDEIQYDGKKVAVAKEFGTDTKYWAVDAGKSTLCEESVIIAKNDSSVVAGSGYGVTMEIYATGTANHYKMVIINEYMATLGKPTKATATTDRKVNFAKVTTATGAELVSYTTEEFEENDVVLFTVSDNKIADMKLAEKIEDVTVTGYKGTTATTSAGEYTLKSGSWDARLGRNVDLYLDSCGYVIADREHGQTAAAPVAKFAYILAAEGTAPVNGSITKAGYTLKVIAVLSDGTKGTYDVPVTKVTAQNKTSDAIKSITGVAEGDYVVAGVIVWDASEADAADKEKSSNLTTAKVFGYTEVKDSTLKLAALPAVGTEAGDVYLAALGKKWDGSSPVMTVGSKPIVVNNATKTLAIDTAKNDVTPYEGKVNLKSGQNLLTTDTWVVVTADDKGSGTAQVVFTTSAQIEKPVAPAAGYAYVDASTESVSVGADNEPVYTYTATDINGTLTVTAKAAKTSGVYELNEDNEIGNAKATKVATVAGEMIYDANNKWLAVTDSTIYIDPNELGGADGAECVIIPNAANTSAAIVFIVKTPAAPAAPAKGQLTAEDINAQITAKFEAIPAGTAASIGKVEVPTTGDRTTKVKVGESTFVVRGTGASDAAPEANVKVWNNSNVNPEDVMAFSFTVADGPKAVELRIKDSAGTTVYWYREMSIKNGTYTFLVNVVNTKGDDATTVYNSGNSDEDLCGGPLLLTYTGGDNYTGTELAPGSYTWEITMGGENTEVGTALAHYAGDTFSITKN